MSDRFDTDDKAKKDLIGRGCWREASRHDGRKAAPRSADELEATHLQLWMNRPRREMFAQERRERSR